MTDALTIIYYIFDKFIDLIFNGLQISNNVTIGWVLVVITIFAILIKNIINLPRSMSSFDKFRSHSYSTTKQYLTFDGEVYAQNRSVTKTKRRY